jgi:hypothetical protein
VDEGKAGQPKMMTVGLHCRLSRPGRIAALESFVDFAKSYGRDVWICTREEIANHWYENHLPRGVGNPIKPNLFANNSHGGFMNSVVNTMTGFGSNSNLNNNNNSSSSSSPYNTNTSSAYTPTSSSFSNPASKFSYLGNLTTPRDSNNALNQDTAITAAAQVPDGDII